MGMSNVIAPEPTPQEAYERIREYFSRPGAVYSLVPANYQYIRGRCQYRNQLEDGTVTRCAVGCLFDDEQYDLLGLVEVEGKTQDLLTDKIGWHNRDLNSLLNAAQLMHDSLAYSKQPVSKFIQRLDQIAVSKGLEVATERKDNAS